MDPAEVIALAEKYFSGWEGRPLPERCYPAEPPQKAEKVIKVPFKAQPALRIGFHNPGMNHPDIYAIIMACEVLTNGKTGRFYKNLVEGRELALHAWAYPSYPGSRYPSLTVIAAAPKAPHTAVELDAALMAEVELLQKEPPTRWELDKILNNYEAEMIKQLESNSGIGMNLAQNEQLMGDWRYDWKVGGTARSAQEKFSGGQILHSQNRTVVPKSRADEFPPPNLPAPPCRNWAALISPPRGPALCWARPGVYLLPTASLRPPYGPYPRRQDL